PPTANAGGPYQATVAEGIALDGTSSVDDEPATLTYVWDFGDGVHGLGAAPTHVYAAAGTYNAKLSVTDRMGATSESTAVVTVRVPNRPPSVVISGPHTCIAPCTLDLTATASDADGRPLTLKWHGCAVGSTSPTATCVLNAVGPAEARVVVKDPNGGVGSAVYEVQGMAPPNRAPTVTEAATGTCGASGCTVTFAASASD